MLAQLRSICSFINSSRSMLTEASFREIAGSQVLHMQRIIGTSDVSIEEASAAMAALSSPDFTGCLSEEHRRALASSLAAKMAPDARPPEIPTVGTRAMLQSNLVFFSNTCRQSIGKSCAPTSRWPRSSIASSIVPWSWG